jgi:hypothetical protein
MELKYDLPQPDIRYRARKNLDDLRAGDVVAYRMIDYGGHHTEGVMVIGDFNMFLVATNWDCYGELWYNDVIDDRIEFFEANEEEISWGTRFLFNYLYCSDDQKNGLEAILKFVEDTFPKENGINWREKERCMNYMIELPWCVSNVDWNEAKSQLWKIAYKEIQDTGLQFNKVRVEFFCFLIGVLMIADSTSDMHKMKELLRTFKNEWNHFVWMYSLTLGRLMGTDLKNFTGVVHQLDNSVRVPYLHLYLPLIEGNVDKICMYNPSEKRYKLENAIRKMQRVEALERKRTDLDEIYQILFPKHFRQAMADNRPAATIADLQQEVATKDEQIKSLESKLSASVTEYKNKYEALLHDFEELARASLKFDVLETNLKKLSRSTAEQIIGDMMLTFDEDERIMKALKKIKKAVRDNDRPTIQHVYENGAVHDDKSTHVNIESKNNDKQVDQLKLEDK